MVNSLVQNTVRSIVNIFSLSLAPNLEHYLEINDKEAVSNLISRGALIPSVYRHDLDGILAEDDLLERLLDNGLDPNIEIKYVLWPENSPLPRTVEEGDRYLKSLSILRRKGAIFPQDFCCTLRYDYSENLIRSVIQWGYNPRHLTLTFNSFFMRIVDDVSPPRWGPDNHCNLTVDNPLHSQTVLTVMTIWKSQECKVFSLLPLEVLYLIFDNMYYLTHPIMTGNYIGK